MAFTATQQVKIRRGLGYPQTYFQANPRLEGAIEVVGADPEASAIVVDLLAKIDAAREDVAQSAQSAGIRTLDKDDVGFYDKNSVTTGKANIGRYWTNELSIMLGVPIANDIFAPGRGYSGDAWAIGNAHTSLMGTG